MALLCHLSWFILNYGIPSKYVKISQHWGCCNVCIHVYVLEKPSKKSNPRIVLHIPLGVIIDMIIMIIVIAMVIGFFFGINHGPTPGTPGSMTGLLHGSLPWHLLRRWHTPGKDHPQRAHAEAPPGKTCENQGSEIDVTQVTIIEKSLKNRLKNLGFMVSTWHPQHGIHLALMWCWCISMWLWIEVGQPIFAEFSSLVRYIATIDQHVLNHKGYWAFIFTPTHIRTY